MVGLILALAFSSFASAGNLECKSLIREFNRDGSVRLEEKIMKASDGSGPYRQHDDEREGRAFNVMETPDYLLFTISQAPDYMDGITSRSGLDSRGEASLSLAAGKMVYRIECRKI